MKKNIFKIALLSVAVMVVSSCSKLPEVELENAKKAVEELKAVEANRYLSAEFNALQDSLNAANVAVETEKSRFFLVRNYDAAKNQLVRIVTAAGELKTKNEEKKAAVRQEAQQNIADVNTLIAENKELLKKAPKGKEGKAALEAIQSDINTIEASVNEVNTLLNNGDYLTANDKAKALKTKAESIKEELNNAIAKTKKRK